MMTQNNGESQKYNNEKGLLHILLYDVGYGFSNWSTISKSRVSGLKENERGEWI